MTVAQLILLLTLTVWAQGPPDAYQNAVGLVQNKQFDRAVTAIRSILAEEPRNLKALNLLGIALSAAGRREDANREFRKALEIDPGFVPALKNLAVNELALAGVALAEGRNREALSALGKIAPEANPQVHFDAGVMLAKLEQYAAAANEFRLAQPGYPDPYQVGYNLALAYLKANQPKPAVEAAERLLASGHKKAELLNLLSQVYENLNRTKEAYDALRSAIELDSRHEASYIDLMTLCLKHENPDLGLEISEIALKALPGSSRVRLHRGVALAIKGQFAAADDEFLAATKAAPDAPLAYVALALVRIQMNRLADAIDLLRKRREVNANDYLANWFLGEAISRSGPEPGSPDERDAVAALEDAVRAAPKSAPPRTLLGKFLARRGETERAASVFEAALALDPEDMTAAYQLAVIYRKRGDTKRAQELFAKVSKAKAEDREQSTRQMLVQIVREGAR